MELSGIEPAITLLRGTQHLAFVPVSWIVFVTDISYWKRYGKFCDMFCLKVVCLLVIIMNDHYADQ